jgi:putative membrane protein
MMGGWMMAGFGILLLLAVGLAVAVLLRPSPGAGGAVAWPSAKELLDQRYARGEIDDDEYYRRLNVLDSNEPMTRAGD